MSPDTSAARATLEELDRRVASGRHGSARFWGGAGVVVELAPAARSLRSAAWTTTVGGFYPGPRSVPTKYPQELSWLFKRLWGDFRPIFGPYKEEFFGRLGNAANRYTSRTDRETPRDLLGAVLHEAWAMLEEVEDGEFRVLMVAPGRAIADDWVDEAERQGYMTTEETRRWFAERGFE